MFFFGVFGIETKQEELGELENIVCKKCGSLSRYTIIKTYNVFHVFFIPFIRWGEKYYLKSRCCKTIYAVTKEDLEKVKEEKNINNIYLEELYSENSYYGYNTIICNNCGKEVEGSFKYCPHCGKKI